MHFAAAAMQDAAGRHFGLARSASLDESLRWKEDYFDEGRWRLDQVVTAVVQGGLVVQSLQELPGDSALLPQTRRVPGELLLVARKPES